MKFGGTSVSKAGFWDTICKQTQERVDDGWHTLIVVSALSGVTDLLGSLAASQQKSERKLLLGELESRHADLFSSLGLEPENAFKDAWGDLLALVETNSGPDDVENHVLILASGERLSSAMGQQVLQAAGLSTHLHDATNLLQADGGQGDSPLSASCSACSSPVLETALAEQGSLHITQGFLAAGPDGGTWLLGRGGSDTSAACLASRLQAEKLETHICCSTSVLAKPRNWRPWVPRSFIHPAFVPVKRPVYPCKSGIPADRKLPAHILAPARL